MSGKNYVKITYVDGGNREEQSSIQTLLIENLNQIPTGDIYPLGDTIEGETFTVDPAF